jgi:hypothetical protein
MAEDRLLTDREQWFARQEQAQEEAQIHDAMQRGQLKGFTAAAFVMAMWQGLDEEPFTHAERVALIQAALRGH